MVMEKPIFGHGLSQFEKLAYDFRSRKAVDLGMVIPKTGSGTHSIVFTLLAEQGIFGFMLFGAILIRFCISAIRGAEVLWPEAGRLWLVSFICVYLINALFVNVHEPATNLIFYGTLGLFAGFYGEDQKHDINNGLESY